MIILETLLVTFIAVKKICELFLSRRKFQFGDDMRGKGLKWKIINILGCRNKADMGDSHE